MSYIPLNSTPNIGGEVRTYAAKLGRITASKRCEKDSKSEFLDTLGTKSADQPNANTSKKIVIFLRAGLVTNLRKDSVIFRTGLYRRNESGKNWHSI